METQRSDVEQVKTEQIKRINTAGALTKEAVNRVRSQLTQLALRLGKQADEQLKTLKALILIEAGSLRKTVEEVFNVTITPCESSDSPVIDQNASIDAGYDREVIERMASIKEATGILISAINETRNALVLLVMKGPLEENVVRLAEAYFRLEASFFEKSMYTLVSLSAVN